MHLRNLLLLALALTSLVAVNGRSEEGATKPRPSEQFTESESQRDAFLGKSHARAKATTEDGWKINRECAQFLPDPVKYEACKSSKNPALLLVPGSSLVNKDGSVRVKVAPLQGSGHVELGN